MEHESNGDTNCNWLGIVPKELVQGLEELGIRGREETIYITV